MNGQLPRIVICGASPDSLNLNRLLRKFVATGFKAHAGEENVWEISLENCPFFINKFKPTLVLIFGSCMPDSCNYTPVRRAAEKVGAKIAFWLHDDPYEFDYHYKVVSFADFIFSNDRFAALHYNTKRAVHLPLAADPQAHLRPIGVPRTVDLFFCGKRSRIGFASCVISRLYSRNIIRS